jgi:hypothetical protein
MAGRLSWENKTKYYLPKYRILKEGERPTVAQEKGFLRDWFNSLTTCLEPNELRLLLLYFYANVKEHEDAVALLTDSEISKANRPDKTDKPAKKLTFKSKG